MYPAPLLECPSILDESPGNHVIARKRGVRSTRLLVHLIPVFSYRSAAKRRWIGKVDFQCHVIFTCVKFPFTNKIEEMYERSLISVKGEPRSTSCLSSPLFILPLFYLRD